MHESLRRQSKLTILRALAYTATMVLPADHDNDDASLTDLRRAFSDRPRRAVAVRAAQLIAENEMSFAQARQRAARELFGNRVPRDVQPDQTELENCLREHLDLFDGPAHKARIKSLRRATVDFMSQLETALEDASIEYRLLVTGAAWKGIVAEHAHGHVMLFCNDHKAATLALLNRGLHCEATMTNHFQKSGSEVEALVINQASWPMQLSLYELDEFRGALLNSQAGSAERGTREQLVEQMSNEQ